MEQLLHTRRAGKGDILPPALVAVQRLPAPGPGAGSDASPRTRWGSPMGASSRGRVRVEEQSLWELEKTILEAAARILEWHRGTVATLRPCRVARSARFAGTVAYTVVADVLRLYTSINGWQLYEERKKKRALEEPSAVTPKPAGLAPVLVPVSTAHPPSGGRECVTSLTGGSRATLPSRLTCSWWDGRGQGRPRLRKAFSYALSGARHTARWCWTGTANTPTSRCPFTRLPSR